MVDRPAPGPTRAEGADPRETSVSPAIRRDGTAGTHTRIANFGRKPGKRWNYGKPLRRRARKEKCHPIRRERHNPGLMKLLRPEPEPPLPREVGVTGE